MADATDIESKISQAVTAQEAGDYTTALTFLRSARLLMAAVPESNFGGAGLKYSTADITAMIRDLEQLAQRSRSSNGMKVRRTKVRYVTPADEDDL